MTNYYYLKDLANTVLALANSSGSIVESYVYDAYGNVTIKNGSGNVIPTSAYGNRFLFQGREYDYTTQLYHFRARWYDPETGRWLSNDPIGISGGLNLYAFCSNDPVNFVDPIGLATTRIYVIGRPEPITIVNPELEELRQIINNLQNSSINYIEFIGHSNLGLIYVNEQQDAIVLQANQVDFSDMSSPVCSEEGSFSSCIKPKMAHGGTVSFKGCFTGFSDPVFFPNNISRALSLEIPTISVVGSSGPSISSSLYGWSPFAEDHAVQIVPVVYRNGKVHLY